MPGWLQDHKPRSRSDALRLLEDFVLKSASWLLDAVDWVSLFYYCYSARKDYCANTRSKSRTSDRNSTRKMARSSDGSSALLANNIST